MSRDFRKKLKKNEINSKINETMIINEKKQRLETGNMHFMRFLPQKKHIRPIFTLVCLNKLKKDMDKKK
jgi:hypothetical protein